MQFRRKKRSKIRPQNDCKRTFRTKNGENGVWGVVGHSHFMTCNFSLPEHAAETGRSWVVNLETDTPETVRFGSDAVSLLKNCVKPDTLTCNAGHTMTYTQPTELGWRYAGGSKSL